MQTFQTRNGSHLVRSNSYLDGRWSSRLYVNDGETATLIAAKHKTREDAERWARKVLASPAAARAHAGEALGT
jgi:hypothetical protein